ncbi:hypothetical protein LUZ60_001435 [Juncus effusus]|nr:hypothetical protein LUZ60_001435 [Juncus effusus]
MPDLSYDLLVSIFSRLSSGDLIVGVAAVCSSWRAAARDPQCWRILDLSDWNSITARVPVPVRFSQVFKRALALARDSECIEKAYLPRVATGRDLILVSNRLPNLLYLSFPNHKLNEKKICTAMANFKSLKGIEAVEGFFFLPKIRARFGTSFTEIKILIGEGEIWRNDNEYLALFVCKEFPKLRKLEMPGFCLHEHELQACQKTAIEFFNSHGF